MMGNLAKALETHLKNMKISWVENKPRSPSGDVLSTFEKPALLDNTHLWANISSNVLKNHCIRNKACTFVLNFHWSEGYEDGVFFKIKLKKNRKENKIPMSITLQKEKKKIVKISKAMWAYVVGVCNIKKKMSCKLINK